MRAVCNELGRAEPRATRAPEVTQQPLVSVQPQPSPGTGAAGAREAQTPTPTQREAAEPCHGPLCPAV